MQMGANYMMLILGQLSVCEPVLVTGLFGLIGAGLAARCPDMEALACDDG